MKSVSIDQSHEVMAKLATNADWTKVDAGIIQKAVKDPKGLGEQFTLFLEYGCRVVIGEVKTIPIVGNFNPETFFGRGWKIIPEETDERSANLKELDFTKIRLETTLKEGETFIGGEKKLRRLKSAGHIRLGGKAFKACWDNRYLLPESWKRDEKGNTRFIFFDGVVLLDPDGNRYVPYLYFEDGIWSWFYNWLENGFGTVHPSAVLAS